MLNGRRRHRIVVNKDGSKTFSNRSQHSAGSAYSSEEKIVSKPIIGVQVTRNSSSSSKPQVTRIAKQPAKVIDAPDPYQTFDVNKIEVTSSGYNPTVTTMSNDTKENSFLYGLIDVEDRPMMRALYKDIYKYDLIAGTAVDLQSTLPYSDFTLTGLKDEKVMEVFQDSVESLNLKTLLPNISVDTFVLGEFVGSLGFDEKRNIFSSLISHDLDTCEFQPLPVYGMDPFIDVTVPKEWITLATDDSERSKGLRRMMPEYLLNSDGGNKIALNPGSTLYLSRQGLTNQEHGTSYFERILMIHFLEKALLRGTIEQAHRRQRSVAHIVVGDDDWLATEDDLNAVAQMYMNADADPLNAVMATRTGIEIQDVKDPSNMWKFDEIYDIGTIAKLRALGINEAFLSGDANISTMETSLSVLVEQMSSNREMTTRKVFYERLFPMIAIANDFKYSTNEEYSTARPTMTKDNEGYYVATCSGNTASNQSQMYERDLKDYMIPRLEWNKKLRPTEDKDYIDMLSELTEKGVPINLRMLTAAGGLNLDELIEDLPEDIKVRNRISEMMSEVEGGDEDAFASVMTEAKKVVTAANTSSSVHRVGFKARMDKFTGEEVAMGEFDANGKRKVISAARKRNLEHGANKKIVEAKRNIDEKNQWGANEAYRKSKL